MALAQEIVAECAAPTKRVRVHTFPARRRAPRSTSEDIHAPLSRVPRSTSDGDQPLPSAAVEMTPITSDDEMFEECPTPTQRVRIHTFPTRRRAVRSKRDGSGNALHAAKVPTPTTGTAASLFCSSPAPRAKVVLIDDDALGFAARKRASASFYNKMCPRQERGAVTLIDESRLPFLKTSPRGSRNQTLLEFLVQQRCAHGDADLTWQKLLEAALSLKQLHAQGVVHGRLQCRNILITADVAQRARVRNFTASEDGRRDCGGDACRGGSSSASDDEDESVRWSAPECLDNEDSAAIALTTQADVFAFGMCILEAVTRTEPWGAVSNSVVRVLLAAGRLPSRPAASFRNDEWELIERMCAKDPARRVGMAFVVARLRAFAARELAARVALQREVPRVLYSETPGVSSSSSS